MLNINLPWYVELSAVATVLLIVSVALSVGLPQESALLESLLTPICLILCSPYCGFSM
jgi:hypothetical protein